LSDNTLVIYTSDNGFFIGDHGWFDKRFMYEPSFKVPLIARLPGVTPAGSNTQSMALNIDLAPTILDFAGAPVPADMPGRSLRPILSGQPPFDWRTSVYYHYYEQEPEHNVAPHYGVRTATHKLIRFYTHDEWELYDLLNDPNELRNVADDPAYAKIRADLAIELERLRKQYADNTP
jgi:arylsulfatase A-like enzyme